MTTLSARIVGELCRVKPEAREALPGEWWRRKESCPNCKSDDLRSIFNSPSFRCRRCGSKWHYKHLEKDGPEYLHPTDLTLPENLHNLFAVADALACLGVDVSYNANANNYDAHISGPDFECLGSGHGPTRTAALLAAVCAALGIEEVANA